MKYVIWLIILGWLLCGVIGAWMLGDLDKDHWKTIVRGPITLATAFQDDPVGVPGLGN